jgi:formate dehydrogenase subunit gamma
VADHAKKVLGLDWHETAKDGSVTLEPIFCLGLCACGPAALIDGKLVGRVDEAKLDGVLEGLK